MNVDAASNLTLTSGVTITGPLPRPVQFEFDFTKTSTFYFDIWTLLATLGLLVIVAVVNAVVFLTWRRQYRNNMAGNTHDVYGNNFYIPNTPTSVSVIDVVAKPFLPQEEPVMNSSMMSPTMSGGNVEVGLPHHAVPVRYVEWSPAVNNHHIDKRIILQFVHE